MKPRTSAVCQLAGVMLVLTLTREASASPSFPAVVAEELGAAKAPPCTVCHTVPTGGLGTAETGLAKYLQSRGLRAGDSAALRTALSAAGAERHDSDGDGEQDVVELTLGADPNSKSELPPPSYGCNMTMAGKSHGAAAGFMLGLAWLLARVLLRRAATDTRA